MREKKYNVSSALHYSDLFDESNLNCNYPLHNNSFNHSYSVEWLRNNGSFEDTKKNEYEFMTKDHYNIFISIICLILSISILERES